MGIMRFVALAGGLTLAVATPVSAQLRANQALAVPPPSASPVAALIAAATEPRAVPETVPSQVSQADEALGPPARAAIQPTSTPSASAASPQAAGVRSSPALVLESRNTVLGESAAARPVVPAAPDVARPVPARERLGLGVPSNARAETGSPPSGEGRSRPLGGGVWRSIAALGLVLLLAVATAWLWRGVARRSGGLAGAIGAGGRAPSGVLEVLGRFPVGGGTTLVLLKLDRRVLLLSHTARLLGRGGGSAGFRTLAEITDPEEVASLILKTRDEQDAARSRSFTGILQRFGRAHDHAELAIGARTPASASNEPRSALDVVVADRAPEPAPSPTVGAPEPVMGPERARVLLESMRDRIPVVDLTRRSRDTVGEPAGSGLRERLAQARAQARTEGMAARPTPVVRVESAQLRPRTPAVQGRVMGGGSRGVRA